MRRFWIGCPALGFDAFKKILNVKIVSEGVVSCFYKQCREGSGYDYVSKERGVNFCGNDSACWLC